ncbi:MAG: hypothetical protein U5R31_09805 [Acidimicrobiia bacterium]|nr:hypothetical protein [Acidimicrobiia bacterium]
MPTIDGLTRQEAWRRFRNRAMLILYPVGLLLMVGALVTGQVLFGVLLLILVAGWNAYFFLLWRPGFNEQYPPEEKSP